MMGRRHPRVFLAMALGAAAVWFTMATSAVAMVTPSSHCHRIPMPCCPPSDAGAAHCAAAQCIVELPQKAEAPNLLVAQAAEGARTVEPQQFPAPMGALVRSATWQPEVFRLKDDLRI
jgi:hypothetical protein